MLQQLPCCNHTVHALSLAAWRRYDPVTARELFKPNSLLPLEDEQIVAKVKRDLATCIPAFNSAAVVDRSIVRLPTAVTHFSSPGSYQSMLTTTTGIGNLLMSGDWIVTQHGSWSHEKAYITGLEAANQGIDRFRHGVPASIIPVEPDEAHIQLARSWNRTI